MQNKNIPVPTFSHGMRDEGNSSVFVRQNKDKLSYA